MLLMYSQAASLVRRWDGTASKPQQAIKCHAWFQYSSLQVRLLEEQVEERMRAKVCTDKDGKIVDLQVRRTKHHIGNLKKHVLADETDAQRVRDNERKCLSAALDGFIRSNAWA